MTKKTNTLILRYGNSSVWYNKNSTQLVLANILQLKTLIFSFLNKNKLKVCFLKFKISIVYIYFFTKFFLDSSFFSKILGYFRKYQNIGYLLIRFGFGSKQLNYLLRTNGFRRFNTFLVEKLNIFRTSLFTLVMQKYLLTLFLQVFRKIRIHCHFVRTIEVLVLKCSILDRPMKKTLFSVVGFRKKFGFLKVKLLGLLLEDLIHFTTRRIIFISLKNIFLATTGLQMPLLGSKYLKDFNFRNQFFIVWLALFYHQSFLIAEMLSEVIQSAGKQHLKKIKLFIVFFEQICLLGLVKCLGFQLRVSGKLGGALRSSRFHYKFGKIKLQTLLYNFAYTFLPSFTKFGVFSIKVWILKVHEKNNFI